MEYIIAIDPSFNKNVGIAWLRLKDKKLFFDSIKIDKEDKNHDTRKLYRIAFTIFNFIVKNILIRGAGPEKYLFAIESQYMGLNPEMTMTLVELRGMIEGMLHLFLDGAGTDVVVIPVNPRSWQSFIGANKMKSEEIKKRSIKYASDLTKKEVTEDEADAISILKYIEKNYK